MGKKRDFSKVETEFLGILINHILEICEKIPKDIQKEMIMSKSKPKFTFDDFIEIYKEYGGLDEHGK